MKVLYCSIWLAVIQPMYFVYIMSSKRHTVFYTGVTNNIVRRIFEHKTGVNRSFSSKYHCDQLLYYEEYSLINDAIAREKELKKFRRQWKFQIISKVNPKWTDLSNDWV